MTQISEETDVLHQRLLAPFPLAYLETKPMVFGKGSAKPGLYLQPRDYQKRLTQVFGPDRWSCETTLLSMERDKKEYSKKTPDSDQKVVYKVKEALMVAATVDITVTFPNGRTKLVSNSGESSMDIDDNKVTAAWAQAFKRACSLLGIGEYLYHLPLPMLPYKNSSFNSKDLNEAISVGTPQALATVGFRGLCEGCEEQLEWQKAANAMNFLGRIICRSCAEDQGLIPKKD